MNNIISAWAITFVPGLILWTWEKKDPLKEINYSEEILEDIKNAAIMMLYIVVVVYAYYPIQNFITSAPFVEAIGWTNILSAPLYSRVILAIFLREFSLYVIHWHMHYIEQIWQTHKWHHSEQKLWWLSGVKSSLTSKLMFASIGLWFPALAIPAHIAIVYGAIASFHNTISHLNIKWRPWMRVVEYVIVTPRYHHVHHLAEERFHNKNLASMLVIFDHIFGTYFNPDLVDSQTEEYGIGEEPVTARMIVGL
ncbi:sterol desaturase family protein [Okeania sp. SIO1F9]|uniref:sterol desaturase family protein n=1 Tax=Okeania sp. SIO1F9 TaxID=2607813 RepID=UPI001450CB71|nr:sterol desaturase family protein [Okeania sp. SIO1F9]NET75672.1 sterol desaturase family protein [Okeania sp. SIO1F9]